MKNFIVLLILIAILLLAIFYIVKSKKSGRKCIGCPNGCYMDKNKQGCCCNNCVDK